MKRRVLQLIALSILPCAGCLEPRGDTYRTSTDVNHVSGVASEDRLWESAQAVLREYRFRLDRIDDSAGVITTFPTSSKHFFEFWRKDVVTREDFWEATMNPLRRRVEIRFAKGGVGDDVGISVTVFKERISTPDRQFNDSSAAYELFGNNLPATTGEVQLTSQDEIWVEIGRDDALAEHLLDRMLKRAGEAPSIEG